MSSTTLIANASEERLPGMARSGPSAVSTQLRQLVEEADAALSRAVTDEPTVVPVTFTLRTA